MLLDLFLLVPELAVLHIAHQSLGFVELQDCFLQQYLKKYLLVIVSKECGDSLQEFQYYLNHLKNRKAFDLIKKLQAVKSYPSDQPAETYLPYLPHRF